MPFPAINRNLAIYGSTIIDTSADDFVYALDAATGTLVWETRILDYQKNPAQQTSGPIVARGMVVSGRGCEPKAGPDASARPAPTRNSHFREQGPTVSSLSWISEAATCRSNRETVMVLPASDPDAGSPARSAEGRRNGVRE